MSEEQKPPAGFRIIAGLILAVAAIALVVNLSPRAKRDEGLSGTKMDGTAVEAGGNPVGAGGDVSGGFGEGKRSAVDRFQDGLREIYAEADAMKRESRIEDWIKLVSLDEIPALVELLDRDPDSKLHAEIVLRLFQKLAASDPQTAAYQIGLREPGPERQRLLGALAILWAGQSLPDSIAWARALPEEERGFALGKVAYEAVAIDPRKALELAGELPGGETRTELVTHIAGEWVEKNPGEIADWAKQISDDGLREQVLSRVAAAWGDSNPTAAAELALKSLPAGKPQDDAVMGIVQRWAQRQPAEAGAWVAQFPEGKLREAAAAELTKLWADQDSGAAGSWLGGQAAGASRDAAVNAYIGKILAGHPESAAQWAAQIGDAALRDSALERVAESWLASDPAGAAAWLAGAQLRPEVKARLAEPKGE